MSLSGVHMYVVPSGVFSSTESDLGALSESPLCAVKTDHSASSTVMNFIMAHLTAVSCFACFLFWPPVKLSENNKNILTVTRNCLQHYTGDL